MSQDETHGKSKRGDHESFGNVSGKSLLYSDEALATADKLLGGTHMKTLDRAPSMEEQIKQKLLLAGLEEDHAQTIASGIRECIDGIRQNGADNTKAVRTVQVFLEGTGVDKKVEQAVSMDCIKNLKSSPCNEMTLATPSQPAATTTKNPSRSDPGTRR